jgi:hypothetical protein
MKRFYDNLGRSGRVIAVGPDDTVVVEIDTDPASATEDLPREWVGSRVDFLCGWREVKDGD